jgi:hypothetical protein
VVFEENDNHTGYANSLSSLINNSNYSGASTALTDIVDKFNAARGYVSQAKQNIPSEDNVKESYTWTDITAVMTPLMKTENMTVNGVPISQAKTNASGVLSGMVGNTFVLDMPSGSGVCADIADFVGTYSGKVKINLPVYGSATTTMTASTNTNLETTYLDAALAATKSITAGSTSSGATVNLSDTYGYVLDFAFRTNASSSNLQLQTAGAQRVYDGSTATNTQGSGSYMEFDSSTSSLNTAAMVNLMSAIRVVFVDLDTSEILGRAKLDLGEGNYTVTGTTVKANLYLYTTSTTEETGEDESKTTVTTETLSQDKSEICALTQNTVRKVSVIVYLDGNMVDNTMVANAASSMTGSMNLQFSSSATLVPMQNTSLYEGSASEAATTTAAANNDGN